MYSGCYWSQCKSRNDSNYQFNRSKRAFVAVVAIFLQMKRISICKFCIFPRSQSPIFYTSDNESGELECGHREVHLMTV